MALNTETLKLFSDIVNRTEAKQRNPTIYGTIVRNDDGFLFAQFDGSEELTPVETTIELKEGQRITAQIINHRAMVTGSVSDVSASLSTVKALEAEIEALKEELKNLKGEPTNV